MTDPLIRKIIDTDLIPTDTLLDQHQSPAFEVGSEQEERGLLVKRYRRLGTESLEPHFWDASLSDSLQQYCLVRAVADEHQLPVGVERGQPFPDVNDAVHPLVLVVHATDVEYLFLLGGMGIINQETFLLNLKRTGYSGIGFACGGFISQISMKKGRYYPE